MRANGRREAYRFVIERDGTMIGVIDLDGLAEATRISATGSTGRLGHGRIGGAAVIRSPSRRSA